MALGPLGKILAQGVVAGIAILARARGSCGYAPLSCLVTSRDECAQEHPSPSRSWFRGRGCGLGSPMFVAVAAIANRTAGIASRHRYRAMHYAALSRDARHLPLDTGLSRRPVVASATGIRPGGRRPVGPGSRKYLCPL